jgi:hypothetical protein
MNIYVTEKYSIENNIVNQNTCERVLREICGFAETEKEFEDHKQYKNYTRGKYLLWFLVEFCLSIHKDYNKLEFVKIKKKAKMVTTLSQSNAIALIAPRCKIPKTLKIFFKNTIVKYVDIKKAA